VVDFNVELAESLDMCGGEETCNSERRSC
jgi:hypothetical protein